MVLMFWEFSVRVFLAGLVAGEFYLLLLRGRPVWLRIAYFVLLAAGWTIIYYLVIPPTANRATSPQVFAWYLVYVHSVPVGFFAMGLELASLLRSRYLPHAALVVVALAIALAWPSFALLTHCRLLECF
jgi:hypothetical protein